MGDEVGTSRLRPREAGVAASAASHSWGVAQKLIRHVSKDNRGREFEKTVRFGHFGAKWCIAGGASSLDASPNFMSHQHLRLLIAPRHNAPHLKNQKNGAFWCILVHGSRETLKIRRISRVRVQRIATRLHERVVH